MGVWDRTGRVDLCFERVLPGDDGGDLRAADVHVHAVKQRDCLPI